MEPDFRNFDSDSPGVQEFIKLLLSRRNFLELSAGAFVSAIALSGQNANATQPSESLALNPIVAQGGNQTMTTIDIPATNPDYFIPNRFKGKTLLVTGVATGIGAATAIRAAREGANIVGVDRKEQELNDTISKIEREGHSAIAVVGNIVETALCDRMVTEAVKAFGGVDLALNAAGVMDAGDPAKPLDFQRQRHLLPNSLHEATDEYWDTVLAVNTTGMFKSLRAELRQMVAQKRGGAIVNIGSIAGLTGLGGNPAYVASKHGVTGLTRQAALDYAPYGIRVNSVNMAATATPMTERAFEFVKESQKGGKGSPTATLKTQSILMAVDSQKRMATVWEQGAIILFLLSNDATNLTGCIYATDGGWTAY